MARYNLISVIVPALNESASLEELYVRTATSIGPEQPFEFIVIDDGSTDQTPEVLARLRQKHGNLAAVSHYRSHGKSLALMQGFDVARGEVAIMMDGDLQNQPEDIPAFLAKLGEGYDLVNGWRENRRDTVSRRWISGVYNFLVAWLLRCPVRDINCGFKAMRRTLYSKLQLRGDLHRLIPAIASINGFRVTEIPVSHAERKYGDSRYRLFRHRGLLDIISLAAISATQYRPFHIFIELAALASAFFLLALAGWCVWRFVAPPVSLAARIGSVLLVLCGIWAALVGTVLPLFGFMLDIVGSQHQDASWRAALRKQTIPPEV
jgi:glycosyltransferase involved in cell wall biosynthesis